ASAALAAGRSVLVAAPTGTGKTVVAEYALRRALGTGRRAFYTTPLKALSNQKFRDFRHLFGRERVGLLTGDIVEHPEGELLVMTTEVYRNMVVQQRAEAPPRLSEAAAAAFAGAGGLERLGCVVFDEVHYIADPERGTAWEEAIICSPPGLQLVCLSATVSNADELAAWMEAVHGEVALIRHDERAVPLEHYYYLNGQLILAVDAQGRRVGRLRGVGGEARRGLYHRRGGAAGRRAPQPQPGPDEIGQILAREGLLPAIYFVFRRRDTEAYAETCAHLGLGQRHARQVEEIVAARLADLRPEDRALGQVQSLLRLLPAGVAYHHAGMLPILKLVVEELFNAGLTAIVFATDTLSLGINMPAKSVVIGELTKFDGEERRRLLPNEYQQLAGRAGRRGIDVRGAAVLPYSPWVRAEDALDIATGELLPIMSGFKIRYNTVLNLLSGAADDPEHVVRVLSSSLREFQLDGHLRAQQDRVRALREAVTALPPGDAAVAAEAHPEFRRARRQLAALERALAQADEELAALEAQVAEEAWRRPSRAELRRALRDAPAGQLVRHVDWGWGVLLGRPSTLEGAVALCLFGTAARFVRGYGELGAVPDMAPLDVPPALAALDEEVADVRSLLPRSEWQRFASVWATSAVPQVETQAAEAHAAAARALAERIAAARERRTRAEGRLADLTAGLRAEAADGPLRAPASEDRRRARRLALKLAEESAELEALRAEKQRRVRERLRGVLAVLERFGYVRRGQPTTKARMLRHVFDPNGLLVCEAIGRGVFDGAAPEDLAEALSWFAFDRDLPFTNRLSLPPGLRRLRDQLFGLHREVAGVEDRQGERLTPGPSAVFWGVAYAWARGERFANLLRAVALAEGDVILALNKTLDLLRQVHDALRIAEPRHPLRPALATAEGLLNRGLVAQCSGLGLLAAAEEDEGRLAAVHAEPSAFSRQLSVDGPLTTYD
ncbi:MAG: DEAD/DEAH box helicase, partial [Chloroflexi bacterium]|nr:DEAD/DEAH box helicase [Chloroflexota bacterium]